MPRQNSDIDLDVQELVSYASSVSPSNILSKIADALSKTATTVVTGGAGALQTAITAASDGDVLEVQDNLVYDPITLPAGKALIIRSATGYAPRFSGTNCIKVDDGAADHIVSGFGFDTYTTGGTNYAGAGIAFSTYHCKCSNLIFHNLSFEEPTAGNAVVLSYHGDWPGGDSYALPPQPSEMSDTISFVSCRFFKACKEGIEGAALLLRAFKKPLVYDCWLDGQELGGTGCRGMMFHNCTDIHVEQCKVQGMTVNGEGIKIDAIGSPVAIRNSGFIYDNDLYKCIEGIDCDDYCDVVVLGNRCTNCSTSGIGIDGGTAPAIARVLAVRNACTRCGSGIIAEAGSICELFSNSCWNNATDFNILNGYTLPGSNLLVPRRGMMKLDDSITWEDLQMPGTSLSLGASIKPPAMVKFRDDGAGSEGVYLFKFNQYTTNPSINQTKELFFAFQVPHAYARGKDLHLHLHWAPSVTGVAGVVGWKVEYTVIKIGSNYPTTSVVSLADTVLAGDPAYKHRITPTGVISGTGLEESSVLVCRLFRDADVPNGGIDTWASDDAYLLSIDIHIPQNKVGTRLEAPPWD